MIFYRENCADAALSEADIDEDYLVSARAILVTGTHFAKPNADAAQRKAMRIAAKHRRKVVFDIDYRPNLWGLAGHAAGEERYIKSDRVSEHLRSVLPGCDLIVGTEEEILIASGSETLHEALNVIRTSSKAVIVLKRGPMGCVVFPDAIPARIEDGIVGRGFPIEVYNVLGAGDAFMSGFLRGWLKGEALETCASWANACGAFAVSRLLCSPESPTFAELQHFLMHGSKERALRRDETLNHIHWATTRRTEADRLLAFAIDHRRQLEVIADRAGAPRERIGDFKRLAVAATAKVADGAAGFGMLLDETYGRAAMADAAKHDFWIGRPMEAPGSRPLRFEFSQDAGSRLIEWPISHTIKCLAFYHPDDAPDLKQEQAQKLRLLYDAARKVGRELLIEIIAGKHGRLDETTVARALEELYRLGIKPDWWKLEPQGSGEAWRAIGAVIKRHDPYCRGIVLLGLEAPEAELERAFATAAGHEHVKGFAVGRTIFNEAAELWLAGKMSDAAAIDDMAARFANLVNAWQRAQDRSTA